MAQKPQKDMELYHSIYTKEELELYDSIYSKEEILRSWSERIDCGAACIALQSIREGKRQAEILWDRFTDWF